MREMLTKLFGEPYQVTTRVNGKVSEYAICWIERLPQNNVGLHYVGSEGKVLCDVMPLVGIRSMVRLN